MQQHINNVLPFADVLRTFGVQGELIIRLRREAPEEINLLEPAFIIIDGYPVPFYFKHYEARGNNKALVIFDDMETEAFAKELVGKLISVKAKETATRHSSPFTLLNYEVLDEKAGRIGTITAFMDIPGNPCLQINNGDQEVLIPFREELIVKTDHKKKVVTTNLPEGLVELNQKS
jgi:16S rRNA processing protein RimM